MNKWSKKKYILVSFPPLEPFRLIKARMLQMLLKSVRAMRDPKMAILVLSDISSIFVYLEGKLTMNLSGVQQVINWGTFWKW